MRDGLFSVEELREGQAPLPPNPFRTQLLKWVGNKQRFAHEIISYFPRTWKRYIEPFLGSGAVLGSLAPRVGVASDTLRPLIEIWQTLRDSPQTVKEWYNLRWEAFTRGGRQIAYERIKGSYNQSPNAPDLLFLARACYGGVVRFRKDGVMSTPCGAHNPISPKSFSHRVDVWHERIQGTSFHCSDFGPIMEQARTGDVVYCDPPYSHTQAILYGAQSFDLSRLFLTISRCKEKGAFVLLSIDGSKKSGKRECRLPIPKGLFEREVLVNCGRSMLRRFQMEGESLAGEIVADRLLLTQ